MPDGERTEPTDRAALATKCKNCQGEIPAAARLCAKCGSYQNWLGGINRSALVLSRLVALISVLSAAVPVIRGALRPTASNLRLVRFYYTENGVSLVLNNAGATPGFVSSCKMIVLMRDSVVWNFNFNLDRPSETRGVKGDTIVELFFKTDMKWMERVLQEKLGQQWTTHLNSGTLTARLEVELTQFNGTTDRPPSPETPLRDFYFKY